MTTTMIEISSFNEKTLTKTTFAPFAWFDWPMQTVSYLKELATPKETRISFALAKEILVKKGQLRPAQKTIVVRKARLSPMVKTTQYEDAEEFKKELAF